MVYTIYMTKKKRFRLSQRLCPEVSFSSVRVSETVSTQMLSGVKVREGFDMSVLYPPVVFIKRKICGC